MKRAWLAAIAAVIFLGVGAGLSTFAYAADISAGDASFITPVTTRYEQENPDFYYEGVWTKNVYSPYAASGWSYSYTDNATSSMNVAFTGTYLAWVTRTTPWSGIAEVVLDAGTPDEEVTMVDTWHWSDLHKQTVYETGILPYGPHTVSIYCTGDKRASSWYHTVFTDAFDIAGIVTAADPAPPMPAKYQQDDPRVTYLGAWSTGIVSLADGGSFATTSQPGAAALVTFNGTGVNLVMRTTPWYGTAKVTLDPGTPGEETDTVDLFSGSVVWQASDLYTKTGLDDAQHTLVIECTGEKNGSSAGTSIALDALNITGSLGQSPGVTKIDDKNYGYCTYFPDIVQGWSDSAWSRWDDSGYWAAYQDTYAYTDNDNYEMTFTFHGIHASWVAATSNAKGKAVVRVYNGTVDPGNLVSTTEVDLYSSSTVWKRSVYSTGFLGEGVHTVVITCLHEKRSASGWYTIDVDRFDIVESSG